MIENRRDIFLFSTTPKVFRAPYTPQDTRNLLMAQQLDGPQNGLAENGFFTPARRLIPEWFVPLQAVKSFSLLVEQLDEVPLDLVLASQGIQALNELRSRADAAHGGRTLHQQSNGLFVPAIAD